MQCICFCSSLYNVCQHVEQQSANNRLIFSRQSVGYKRRGASRETRESSEISLLGRCFRFLPDARVLHVPICSNLIHDEGFLKSVDSDCFELV